jgi:DcmR-like sensory protein
MRVPALLVAPTLPLFTYVLRGQSTNTSRCKSGLESEEYCLWIVAEPLRIEEATGALKDAVPALDRYLADSRLEIASARDWFLRGGTLRSATTGLSKASGKLYQCTFEPSNSATAFAPGCYETIVKSETEGFAPNCEAA